MLNINLQSSIAQIHLKNVLKYFMKVLIVLIVCFNHVVQISSDESIALEMGSVLGNSSCKWKTVQ